MQESYDVIIVGAGIMGLLGAYEIVQEGGTVAVIDKAKVGNKSAGSSGLTRSLRSDYKNPTYAQLARESLAGWAQLEKTLGQELYVRTGCLNLANVKAGEISSYAERAAKWLTRDAQTPLVLQGAAHVSKKFPQFSNFNYAVYEASAGLGFPNSTLQLLKEYLEQDNACRIYEETVVKQILSVGNRIQLKTNKGILTAKKVIVAAGLGSTEVLKRVEGLKYRLTLTADRPAECVYYFPKDLRRYSSSELPIFACLDVGVYGHPIVKGRTRGVKIGRYSPPVTVNQTFKVSEQNIKKFVRNYLPELATTSTIQAVTDTDQCAYDMTPDEGFVVGVLSERPQIFVATGFCGTGYKFAPVIAKLMADLGYDREYRYNIDIFNPERFNV